MWNKGVHVPLADSIAAIHLISRKKSVHSSSESHSTSGDQRMKISAIADVVTIHAFKKGRPITMCPCGRQLWELAEI